MDQQQCIHANILTATVFTVQYAPMTHVSPVPASPARLRGRLVGEAREPGKPAAVYSMARLLRCAGPGGSSRWPPGGRQEWDWCLSKVERPRRSCQSYPIVSKQ